MKFPSPDSWTKAFTVVAGFAFALIAGGTAEAGPPIKPPKKPPSAIGNGPGTVRSGDGASAPSGSATNQPVEGDQEFVQIAPGYLLYAEQFYFADSTRKSGRAIGHVFIQLPPNFALLGVTFVHADSADFDVRAGWMVLRGWPEVLMGSTIHRAATPQTRMRLTWMGTNRGLTTVGDETLQMLRPGDIKGKVDDDGTTP